MKYAWIKNHGGEFPASNSCKALKVSRSGYYAWNIRSPSAQSIKREMVLEKAKTFHKRSYKIYGYHKIHKDILKEAPEAKCALETLRKIMKKEGLRSIVRPKFVYTTDSNHNLPVAENILNRDFSAIKPNQKWVSDITYIRTLEGWL